MCREMTQDKWLYPLLEAKVYFGYQMTELVGTPLETSIPNQRNSWCVKKIMVCDLYFCDFKIIPWRHLCVHFLTRLIKTLVLLLSLDCRNRF